MTAARPYRVRTPRPAHRPTLIYQRWKDMQSRCKGQATRCPELYASVRLGFRDFHDFRGYALAHGFSKVNSSPDRIDEAKGYEPGNIRFVPPHYNTLRALPQYRDEPPPLCDCGATCDPHELDCPDYVPF